LSNIKICSLSLTSHRPVYSVRLAKGNAMVVFQSAPTAQHAVWNATTQLCGRLEGQEESKAAFRLVEKQLTNFLLGRIQQ
jgi:hypothetical protein